MNQLRYIIGIFRPLYPVFLTLTGAFGSLYCLGVGSGGKLITALFLIILLAGICLFAYDETRKNDFFEAHFNDKLGDKSKSKRSKRIGKRCPSCQRVIHHKRHVCQHCGYNFIVGDPDKSESDPDQKTALEKEISS